VEAEALAHGVALPRPAPARPPDPDPLAGAGRPGKATLEAWLLLAEELPEGLPELKERRDCAVDDFSFNILELFCDAF